MKHEYLKLAPSADGKIIYFPKAADCLAQTDLYEQQILLPFLTIPGESISPRYAGIPFHLIGHPVGWSDVMFRILEDGRYELLDVDGLTGEELTEMLEEEEPDDELFDDLPAKPRRMSIKERNEEELRGSFVVEIGAPTWVQGTYDAIPPTDDPESTVTRFKDEAGNSMEFVVATLRITHVFGYYYLFYAPATRTVMQVFQCT